MMIGSWWAKFIAVGIVTVVIGYACSAIEQSGYDRAMAEKADELQELIRLRDARSKAIEEKRKQTERSDSAIVADVQAAKSKSQERIVYVTKEIIKRDYQCLDIGTDALQLLNDAISGN